MKKISVGVADDNRDYCDLISDYFSSNKEIEISFVANDGIKTIRQHKKVQSGSFNFGYGNASS